MSRTVRIDLAYDGAGFHGWQIQPELRTVQGMLAAMLERLLGREATPTGAGRTDTGVHALGQTAHFGGLNEDETGRLIRALPGVAPDDIRITRVVEVSPAFDARFSARWRRYEYRLALRDDLFRRGTEWQLSGVDLDRDAMDAACVHLLGNHDYRSFCKTSSWKETNDCDVSTARFEWSDDGAVFHVTADRFLHHMVRTLVGTLVETGQGRRAPDDLPAIIAAKDRSAAGTMAPPQGLYLAEVGYPDELMDPGFMPDTDPRTEETP